MELKEMADVIKEELINSPIFPYRTGRLKRNFIDKNSDIDTGDEYSFTILSDDYVAYGRILQERASIRYRTKNHIIRHKNRHFRYIDKIVEQDIVHRLESQFNIERLSDESE